MRFFLEEAGKVGQAGFSHSFCGGSLFLFFPFFGKEGEGGERKFLPYSLQIERFCGGKNNTLKFFSKHVIPLVFFPFNPILRPSCILLPPPPNPPKNPSHLHLHPPSQHPTQHNIPSPFLPSFLPFIPPFLSFLLSSLLPFSPQKNSDTRKKEKKNEAKMEKKKKRRRKAKIFFSGWVFDTVGRYEGERKKKRKR